MFKTVEQLESSTICDFYKSQIRPKFSTIQASVFTKRNKYHNEHVYVCAACDSICSVEKVIEKIGLKNRPTIKLHCAKCGPVTDRLFFSSKKEARRYFVLQAMKRAGEVLSFKRQVPYPIILNSGKRITYYLDFLVEYKDRIEHEDVKGKRLPEYITKKKLVEDRFGIVIKEV